MGKDMSRQFTTKSIKMALKYMKRKCSNSFIIKEKQIRTMKHHLLPNRLEKIKNYATYSVSKAVLNRLF